MIRLAKKDELSEIYAIWRSQVGRPFCVWSEMYPNEQNLEFDYENDKLYVFIQNDVIVGCLSIDDVEELAHLEELETRDGNQIEISRVAIRTDYQGSGLAAVMIAEFATLCRKHGVSAIQLLVAKANPPAIRTYVKNGFIIKGETFMYDNDYYVAELILNDIEIGLATADDLDGLMELYTELHDNPIPEDMSKANRAWELMMNDPFHNVIVARINGIIVSSVICLVVPNLTHEQRPYCLIENVITSADVRNRGLATKCLDFAYSIAIANNCYKLMLLTGSKKESTLNFYRKAGYNSEDKTAFIRWIK